MLCDDVKMFWRYMQFFSGSVFIKYDGTGWYVGTKQNEGDIFLASYNYQAKPADLYCDILREMRENTFIDNDRKNRDRFTKAAIGYIYETLLDEGLKVFPSVTPGGKKYNRRLYER